MPESLVIVFSLAGGLGMFLYGMHMMSEGLTSVAGDKMRNVLASLTKNVVEGTLVGALFTAIIQSSNATTVLVVGFVNAELMNLYQAAGIIMGANIGTTMTGLLMTIKLSTIAPLIVFIGVVMFQFCKKQSVKNVGLVVLGFGILFVGLSTMSSSMEALKDTPIVVDTLTSLTNPILAVLIGCLVTAILQSASAMVGILIVLASTGLISVDMCFYLTLGCNIGCTFSAILASLTGSRNAKRAAAFHLSINIIGTIVMGVLLALFMPAMLSFIGSLSSLPGTQVAYANTIFKVFQVLICMPFYRLIVDFTGKILPEKAEEKKEGFKMYYIPTEGTPINTTTAFPQAVREVVRMSDKARDMLNMSVNSLLDVDTSTYDDIHYNEEYIDYMNRGINEFLIQLNTLPIPEHDAKLLGPMFHVLADIERIGDHSLTIAKKIKVCEEKGYHFNDKHRQSIQELLTLVNSELEMSMDMFENRNIDHLKQILAIEKVIDDKESDLQKQYLSDMKRRVTGPREGMVYSDVIASLERIGDHCTNIAFSILNSDSSEVEKLVEEGVDLNEFLV